MTTGPKTISGKPDDPAARLASAFVWIALFLTIPVGRLRDLIGPEALICGYVLFAALFAGAVWKVGSAKRTAQRYARRSCLAYCSSPARPSCW
jgi:hypothetical protein